FVSRPEGVVLMAAYGFYVNLVIREGRLARLAAARIEHEIEEEPRLRLPPLVRLLMGLALVYLGATVLVGGGIRVLDQTSLAAGLGGSPGSWSWLRTRPGSCGRPGSDPAGRSARNVRRSCQVPSGGRPTARSNGARGCCRDPSCATSRRKNSPTVQSRTTRTL